MAVEADPVPWSVEAVAVPLIAPREEFGEAGELDLKRVDGVAQAL